MHVVFWILEILKKHPALLLLLAIVGGFMVVAALVVFFCQDRGVYFALYSVAVGVSYLLLSANNTPLLVKSVCLALEAIFGGSVYFLLQLALAIKKRAVRRARKKRAQENGLRQIEYTLPQRDNSFIRARLHTALRPDITNEAVDFAPDFRLEHARKLLYQMKNAPLSPAERLQLEDTEKLFYVYWKKERWTAEDVRLVNEIFSYLLKLSAKYAV